MATTQTTNSKPTQSDRVAYNLTHYRHSTRESVLREIEDLYTARHISAHELSRLEGLVDEHYPE